MSSVSVQIPDGKYCDNCPFVNHYKDELVNIFGDPTGNIREGYRCNRYKTDLEKEDNGCYFNLKKCWPCTATEEEKLSMGYAFLVMFGLLNKDKENEQNII